MAFCLDSASFSIVEGPWPIFSKGTVEINETNIPGLDAGRHNLLGLLPGMSVDRHESGL